MRKRRDDAFDEDNSFEIEQNFDDENSSDIYESDLMDEFYDDPDDILGDLTNKKSIEEELKEEKKKRKKEFYVKGSDLKDEIQKYHESKKTTEDRKRNCFRRTWINDFKNMYTFFYAPKVLWLFIPR